ncbi:response regulator transcription factor [Acidothermaceae bacterium B102]|nr:response regulator transcription factor [Acidothermaceae bacterium B102]
MRVILCDDSGLFRAGLAGLLRGIGLEVVAEADTTAGLLTTVEELLPDCIIIDLRMPPTFSDEGLVAALAICESVPQVGVLVLSTYVETTYAVRLLADDRRGIGYLLKDRVDDAASLLASITRVAAGETVIDPVVVTRLLERNNAGMVLDVLSQREREVLALVAQGRTNAAIADALFLSPKTVEAHVASTFTKLGIAGVPDANRRVLAVLTYLRAGGHTAGA